MLCQECPSKSVCQSACPELELHLKEIEVPQRELPIGTPRYGKMPTPKNKVKLSKREQQIVTFLADGKTYAEISESLNITQENVKNIVSRCRKKLP